MDKKNWVKILGSIATVVSFGITLLSDWVSEQKMDEKIDEKVNAALAEREEKES